MRTRKQPLRRAAKRPLRIFFLISVALTGAFATAHLFGWDALPHQQIVDATLTAIPASDQLSARFGSEARHLRDTVEMADWVNSLIVVEENWHVTTEDFPQIESEYFGNDYLLFPSAPHTFDHGMPGVVGTYRPFFLRALQALRTEDQANAARWVGSLLHFVTDSGSPPHTLGIKGANHVKMESWLDASKIDLRDYRPRLLGSTDEEALDGLEKRMEGLISRNAAVAREMLPYAQANDRAKVEPLSLDCAVATAKVTADVLHTLLVLTAKQPAQDGASLTATVNAPALQEHPLLPAKLVLLGTDFSTLSSLNYDLPDQYSGTFDLRNLPPGEYHAAIERPGAETLVLRSFSLHKGQHANFDWRLRESSPPGNLVPDPDFVLHWVSASSPDHWRHDDNCRCWLSDNIPVTHGKSYRAWVVLRSSTKRDVVLEWMAQHWKRTADPAIPVPTQADPDAAALTAPDLAVYARFSIAGNDPPGSGVQKVVFVPLAHAGSRMTQSK